MISPVFQNKIASVFNEIAEFAFLFGSANTKYFNKKSDIDIAVWLKKFPLTVNTITDIKYSAEKIINFKYNIDLIILNNANIIITNQIITKGKIIVDNNPLFTENFINTRRSMYLDFKFFRKPLEENLKTTVL